jgi:hypothetical protein
VRILELPISRIDKDAHRNELIAMGEEAAESFPIHIESLQNLFRTVFPPDILATIANWGMLSPVGPDGTSGNGMIEGINQHHIELLQALMLTIDSHEWGKQRATSSHIQQAINTIKEVSFTFHAQRLQQLRESQDNDALLVVELQEKMRYHTQMVRNWGYYDDMLRIVRSWHAPLDRAIERHHGFSASDLISTVEHLVSLHQKRLGSRFVLLKDIFKGRTKKKIIYDFFARFDGVRGDPAALLNRLPKHIKLRELRMILAEHANRSLIMEMLIDPANLAKLLGQPISKVIALLRTLSMVPGNLKSSDTKHLFLANPVWRRPGVLVDDNFLFFIPQSLPAHLPIILRKLCEEAGIEDHLARQKSKYLEEETSRIIKSVLPEECVINGAQWRWQGVQYETDVLATIDRTLLIVEAKSHNVSTSTLRGAPKALKQHVQRLLVEPAEQSSRLSDIVKSASEGDPEALAVVSSLNIEAQKIDAIARISVTLDDISVMAKSEFELKQAGWVPQSLKLPPTLNLAELGACADILSGPSHFLNYFKARERLQGMSRIFGYEMDYLGLYVENGLNSPELLAGTHTVMIVGMSSEIDRYYLSRNTGSPVPKPGIKWT